MPGDALNGITLLKGRSLYPRKRFSLQLLNFLKMGLHNTLDELVDGRLWTQLTPARDLRGLRKIKARLYGAS